MNRIRRSNALPREIRVASAFLPENDSLLTTTGYRIPTLISLLEWLNTRTGIIRTQQIFNVARFF